MFIEVLLLRSTRTILRSPQINGVSDDGEVQQPEGARCDGEERGQDDGLGPTRTQSTPLTEELLKNLFCFDTNTNICTFPI